MSERPEDRPGLDEFDRIIAALNRRRVDFDKAWARRETGRFGREDASYISREDLVANKRAVGRPRDIDDARELGS